MKKQRTGNSMKKAVYSAGKLIARLFALMAGRYMTRDEFDRWYYRNKR
jgi:hypothetical protein